jgi:hypothetical protein
MRTLLSTIKLKKATRLMAMAATLVVSATWSSIVAAGPFDGSMPLLCAATEVMECAGEGECQRRTAEAVNLPPFINIDFKGKLIGTADGSGRTTPIQRLESGDGRVIIQGGQEGRAWSMVISDTGKLSVGILDDELAVVVFGACTAR